MRVVAPVLHTRIAIANVVLRITVDMRTYPEQY